MGQAKLKKKSAFSNDLIQQWESEDCVNFAVALARLTGWLLHVDWFETAIQSVRHQRGEHIPENELEPLRVYVGDIGQKVFDVSGVKNISEFSNNIIRNVLINLGKSKGGVCTRFYSEEKLFDLPLRFAPNEEKIQQAILEIQKNEHFLSSIAIRKPPTIPAHLAAEYSLGDCVVYSEALYELTGLEPIALLAKRFSPNFSLTNPSPTGYFHSVNVHPNGMVEDSWGVASLNEIARRFGVLVYECNAEEHQQAVKNLSNNTKEEYLARLDDARDLIKKYRLTGLQH